MAEIERLMVKDGVLYHSWCEGKHVSPAYLEDYANLSRAHLALYEVTGEMTYMDKSQNYVAHLDQFFWDEEIGGYNFAATQTVDGLSLHQKPIHDNATPSGNGTMAKCWRTCSISMGISSMKIAFLS